MNLYQTREYRHCEGNGEWNPHEGLRGTLPITLLPHGRAGGDRAGLRACPRLPAPLVVRRNILAPGRNLIRGGDPNASRIQYLPQLLSASTCEPTEDRKSTRLNSSHRCISYAV